VSSLVVHSPDGERSFVHIEKLPFTIGRHPGSSLILPDHRISRTHARIFQKENTVWIEDQGSSHGLFLNGARIAAHPLRSGDLITFGPSVTYQVQYVAAPGSGVPDLFARLREVLETAQTFERSSSPQIVFGSLIDTALRIIGAQRGFLFQQSETGLSMLAARDDQGEPLSESSLRVPLRLIEDALTSRRDAFAMNFEGEDSFDPGQTVMMLELRSSVFVPLPRARGLLYFDSRAERANLAMGNRELLETLALEASAVIENIRSLEEERHRKRLEEDLSFAREIQQSLLPPALPQHGWVRAAGSSKPSRAVGGDYYDIFPLGTERFGIVLADVSGKGVSAALLASFLQGAILMGGDEILFLFKNLNRFLLERTGGGKYATIFYGVLHRDGRLVYANAGQSPPLLVRSDGSAKALEATGVPIGLLEDAEHTIEQQQMKSGDKLVLFSDGFAESLPEDSVSNFAHLDAKQIQTELLKRCPPDAPEDDQTLLVVEFTPD
jgi:sigma-B regulation protein RsbU (phosphoserine phosphatase)